jgi:hypothetical protein
MSVSIGASGAIFGIYGLLLASLAWAVIGPPAVPVSWTTAKQVAAAAVLFFLYNLVSDHLSTASELAGLGTGFVGGLVVARGVTREKPRVHRVAMVMAAAALIAIGGAIPLRGIIDVRPEIARVAAAEERTAGAYEIALAKFRRGRITEGGLVKLIDGTIVPDLQAVRTRLNALRGVPREQAPMVTAAEEYSRLREESWRRRSEGLLKSNMKMLREADQTERAALDAFQKMRPAL